MTRRPFPAIDSPRVLPDRRRPDPWPWIALVLSVGVIAWVITRQSPAPVSPDGPAVSQPVAATGDDGPLLTVVAWLVMTQPPTVTPRPTITPLPSPTPTATVAPLCGQERMGSPCLLYPPPMTPTPTATPQWCDHVTPSSAGYPAVCKPVYVSSSREDVGASD